MSSFATAFVASFLGGVVVTGLIALLDRYFPVPTQSFAAESVIPFPHPRRLRAASFLVFVVWLCLIVFVVCLVLGLMLRRSELIFGSFGLFIGCATAYVALALTLRCTKCRKHVTIQWVSEPRFHERILGMEGWASVVLNVALKRRFRCMYCGQQFVVSGDPE